MNTLPDFIEPDPWLAAIMKRDVYRLRFDAGAVSRGAWPDRKSVASMQRGPVFLYAKVPVAEVVAAERLTELGFRLVDTNVLFGGSICGGPGCPAVRPALPADRSAVVGLARSAFATSRFHLDPRIPGDLADAIKAEWAASYFDGRRGDALWVVESEGELAGFVLLLHGAGGVTIDLIATASGCRRRGLARALIAGCCADSADRTILWAGTQLANGASIGLYERIGLRVCRSHYVFHDWRG